MLQHEEGRDTESFLIFQQGLESWAVGLAPQSSAYSHCGVRPQGWG